MEKTKIKSFHEKKGGAFLMQCQLGTHTVTTARDGVLMSRVPKKGALGLEALEAYPGSRLGVRFLTSPSALCSTDGRTWGIHPWEKGRNIEQAQECGLGKPGASFAWRFPQ